MSIMKELDDFFKAAQDSEEWAKHQTGNKFVSTMSEEEKERKRAEILRKRRIELEVKERSSLYYLYQWSREEFLNAVKAVIKKKVSYFEKDWIACVIFPSEKDDEITDINSTIVVYVRINGKKFLRKFIVHYESWREDMEKFPQFNRFLQMHMNYGDLHKTELQNFSEIEDFDGKTVSYVY